jgi:hypothetical protein
LQAQALLKDQPDAIILFDEIEDLMMKGGDRDKKPDTFSKIIVNRLLEKNQVVTLWAGNDLDKFDEPVRQRFSYSVYVGYPPMEMRRRIWVKQLALHNGSMDDATITSLARRYNAPPRMIDNAIRLSTEDGVTNPDQVRKVIEASSKITYGSAEDVEALGHISDRYNPALLTFPAAHQNEITSLLESMNSAHAVSMFVQGPPGSGLRSFGRYFAEKAVLNPREVDLRDILAPHPMVSPEDRLQRAFARAADSRNLLIVSNLDAFVERPDSAAADWDDSLAPMFVEELLRHKLPVLAHSYKPDLKLPPFMSEAFYIRTSTSALSAQQAEKAHLLYLHREPPEGRTLPQGLMIGDFARAAKILAKGLNGHTPDERVADVLRNIAQRREEGGGRGMGFVPQAIEAAHRRL